VINFQRLFHFNQSINTIIKTTSICDASSVDGGRVWLAGDTDGLAGWPVMVGVVEVGVVDTHYGVSHPGTDAEWYSWACLHCTQGLAGRGDGYQCRLDWGRSSTIILVDFFSCNLTDIACAVCPFIHNSIYHVPFMSIKLCCHEFKCFIKMQLTKYRMGTKRCKFIKPFFHTAGQVHFYA